MAEKFYCMAKECVFLQTNDREAQLDDNPLAGPVLARKIDGGKYEYVQLEETEAFILRLLLQQLGMAPLKQALIWKSKFQPNDKLTDDEAKKLIQDVVNQYEQEGFIQSIKEDEHTIKDLKIKKDDMKAQVPKPDASLTRKHFKKLHLKASINQLGPIVIRFTFPPLR